MAKPEADASMAVTFLRGRNDDLRIGPRPGGAPADDHDIHPFAGSCAEAARDGANVFHCNATFPKVDGGLA